MAGLSGNHSIRRLLLTALISTLVISFHKSAPVPAKFVSDIKAPVVAVEPVKAESPPKFDLADPATWPSCAENEWHWADDGQCHKKPARAVSVAPMANSSDNCEKWRPMIAQYPGWNVDVAVNVCTAESHGDPNTANWTDGHPDIGCSGSFGLFQINCGHGQVYSPSKNIAIAYSMYQARGWKPWSSTTCRYKVDCY